MSALLANRSRAGSESVIKMNKSQDMIIFFSGELQAVEVSQQFINKWLKISHIFSSKANSQLFSDFFLNKITVQLRIRKDLWFGSERIEICYVLPLTSSWCWQSHIVVLCLCLSVKVMVILLASTNCGNTICKGNPAGTECDALERYLSELCTPYVCLWFCYLIWIVLQLTMFSIYAIYIN